MVGSIISHFKVLEKLGEGGMGVVYQAMDLRLRRLVALKVLPAHHSRDTEHRARFLAEARTASALNHPNIATVYEIETVDDTDYIAMELVQGETLRQRIAHRGLSFADVLNYATQIASGLAAAHAAGIVHRDIKPANIMVTDTGLIKILDFGLARIEHLDEADTTLTNSPRTKSGVVVGTIAYMSPEQVAGKPLDARSDIFSFGIVLFEMLTGEQPFKSNSTVGLMYEIVHQPARTLADLRADVPAGLHRILNRALEKDLSRRYQNSEDLLRDLRQCTRELETGARSTAIAPTESIPTPRKWRWPLAAAVLLLALAVAGWKADPWLRDRSRGVPTEKKIAVLPFLNVGGAPENQALCDGIMEALTSELSQLEQNHGSLWVVPSTEVRREQLSSAADARRALGANLVISGSIQRDATHIHLTASLVDADTLRQLSSRTMQKPIAEFADLQDTVVREIADMLKIELNPQDSRVLAATQTKTAGAYDLYLQAQGYLQHLDVPNLDHAIDLFQSAVAQDPNYVLAYAGLGEAYWKKYRATSDRQWVELAQVNCDRAVAINNRLAPVYVTLGIVQEGTGHHEDAIHSFQRALELDPINADAHSELGITYLAAGRLEDAENIYKKAVELRPSDFTSLNNLGLFYYRRGRYKDAEEIFRRITQLVPDNSSGYTNLGAVYWAEGQYADAAVSYEKSLARRQTASAYTSLGTVYFFLDRCPEAVPLMEKASQLLPKNDQIWGNLGDVYGCTPDGKAKAAEAWRRAVELSEERLAVNPRDADTLGRVALYRARLGEKGIAVSNTRQSIELAPSNRSVEWHAALTYELAGQRDLALKAIAAALDAGQPVLEVTHEPTLARMRSDPRYQRLIADRAADVPK